MQPGDWGELEGSARGDGATPTTDGAVGDAGDGLAAADGEASDGPASGSGEEVPDGAGRAPGSGPSDDRERPGAAATYRGP